MIGYRIIAIPSGADGTSQTPFQAVVLLEFDRLEDFEAASTAPCGLKLLADMPNYTDVEPTILVGADVSTWTV